MTTCKQVRKCGVTKFDLLYRIQPMKFQSAYTCTYWIRYYGLSVRFTF